MPEPINPERSTIVSLPKADERTERTEAPRVNYHVLPVNPEASITVLLPKAPPTDEATSTTAGLPIIIESITIDTGKTINLDVELHIRHLYIKRGAKVVTDTDTFTTVVDGQTLTAGTIYFGPLKWDNVDVSFGGESAFFDYSAE
jgi:hypothetical protein